MAKESKAHDETKKIEEHEVVTVSKAGTYQKSLAATGSTPIVDPVAVSPSLAMQQKQDAQREETIKATLAADDKAREEAAEQYAEHSKKAAEEHAERSSSKAEVVKLKVSNPLSTVLEVGIAGRTIYIKPGESDIFAPPGIDAIALRRAVAKRASLGVAVVEDEKKRSVKASAGGEGGLDNNGVDYEPSTEEIDQFLEHGRVPTPSDPTFPFREPGPNGSRTDEEVEEQRREYARSELKRQATLQGKAEQKSAKRAGAARRIAEEK